jgi:hypothetical protein
VKIASEFSFGFSPDFWIFNRIHNIFTQKKDFVAKFVKKKPVANQFLVGLKTLSASIHEEKIRLKKSSNRS